MHPIFCRAHSAYYPHKTIHFHVQIPSPQRMYMSRQPPYMRESPEQWRRAGRAARAGLAVHRRSPAAFVLLCVALLQR